MKHIFLNLKRFDVPVELGGVNRLAAPADWGRVIVAHQENPMRRIVIFREQKYILLLSLVPVVSQHHFPDMVITISIQEWGSVDRVAGVKCPAKIVSLFL